MVDSDEAKKSRAEELRSSPKFAADVTDDDLRTLFEMFGVEDPGGRLQRLQISVDWTKPDAPVEVILTMMATQ